VYEGPPDDAIGGFTVQEDGALLLFMAGGAVRVWRGEPGPPLVAVADRVLAERPARFNDVIADPSGRVFCGLQGATADSPGWLYRLDVDGGLQAVVDGARTPNGMGFTPDRTGLYFTDSPLRRIFLYDYDEATGAIGNRRVFARAPDDGRDGSPDGMTVDAEGCVWSARWGGGCVVRYSPAGEEIGRIAFPARYVSSCTFGGEDYRDLYVTTALNPFARDESPGAGALYRVRPGVMGVPEFLSRVRPRAA
jgi:D-xylonolactonase